MSASILERCKLLTRWAFEYFDQTGTRDALEGLNWPHFRHSSLTSIFECHVCAQIGERALTGPCGAQRALLGLDPKESVELVLPLAQKGLRQDQENPLPTLREQLSNDQTRFNRFAEADFICKNAAAFWNALQCEDDRVDLMRVRVDTATALGRRVPTMFARPAKAHELFSLNAAMDRMWCLLRQDSLLNLSN